MQSCGYAIATLGLERNILKSYDEFISVKRGDIVARTAEIHYTIKLPENTTRAKKPKKDKKKDNSKKPSTRNLSLRNQGIVQIIEKLDPVHIYVKASVKQDIFTQDFNDYHVDIWVDKADIPEEDKPDKGQGAIKGVIFTIQKNTYTEISLEFLEDGYTVNQVVGLPNGLAFKNGIVRGSLTNSGIYEFVIIGSNSENQQVELQCKIEVPQLIRLL